MRVVLDTRPMLPAGGPSSSLEVASQATAQHRTSDSLVVMCSGQLNVPMNSPRRDAAQVTSVRSFSATVPILSKRSGWPEELTHRRRDFT